MPEEPRLHTGLDIERWHALSIYEQVGNIGSEFGRAVRANRSGRPERAWGAIERMLELFALTIGDPKHETRLKEFTRSREVVLDFLVGDNAYRSTAESLQRYFDAYAIAARRNAGLVNPTIKA